MCMYMLYVCMFLFVCVCVWMLCVYVCISVHVCCVYECVCVQVVSVWEYMCVYMCVSCECVYAREREGEWGERIVT